MSASIYKDTIRKSSKAKGTVFALGRDDRYHGYQTRVGGYYIFKLCENYDGKVRGGIRKTWRVAVADLSYEDAIKKMNSRLGRNEFTPIAQKDIKGNRS